MMNCLSFSGQFFRFPPLAFKFSLGSRSTVAPEAEGVGVYKSLRKSLAHGGFQLTKWIFDSEKVMEKISPEDRSVVLSRTSEAELLAPSILGLQWIVKSDSLEICRGMGKEVTAKITQRIVLSQVSSVFDPSSPSEVALLSFIGALNFCTKFPEKIQKNPIPFYDILHEKTPWN